METMNPLSVIYADQFFSFCTIWMKQTDEGEEKPLNDLWVHSKSLSDLHPRLATYPEVTQQRVGSIHDRALTLGGLYCNSAASSEEERDGVFNRRPLVISRTETSNVELAKLFAYLAADPTVEVELSVGGLDFAEPKAPFTFEFGSRFEGDLRSFIDERAKAFYEKLHPEGMDFHYYEKRGVSDKEIGEVAAQTMRLFEKVTAGYFLELSKDRTDFGVEEHPAEHIIVIPIPKHEAFQGSRHQLTENVGILLVFFWRSDEVFQVSPRSAELLYAAYTYGRAELETSIHRELEMERERAVRKAARASILARNFSHVTGSHVLSNPDFRRTLTQGGPDDLTERYICKLQEVIRKHQAQEIFAIDETPTDIWKSAVSDLEATRSQFRSGLNERIIKFHHYLQGRFDFIARAVDGTYDREEPVLLIRDLLEGFLGHTSFLNAFVSDLGISLENICVTVILPNHVKWEVNKWDRSSGTWRPVWKSLKGGPEGGRNVLVGIPGGVSSRHAFYALLENVIRNSVKYGVINNQRQERKPYRLKLALVDDEDVGSKRYVLRIWDNYSALRPEIYEDLQAKLNRGELDEESKPIRDGLGIQEMQICAKSLVPKRAVKDNPDRTEGELRLVPAEKCASLERIGVESDSLVYEMPIAKPVLVGIWSKGEGMESRDGIIRRTVNLKALLDQYKVNGETFAAHLLVIDGDKVSPKEGVETVLHHHTFLPYRLFAVCSTVDRLQQWEREVLGATHPGDKVHEKLPSGRLRVVLVPVDDSLRDLDWRERDELSLEEKEALSLSVKIGLERVDQLNGQELAIQCYEAWLEAWRGRTHGDVRRGREERAWDVWIGFDREVSKGASQDEGLKGAWKKCIQGCELLRSVNLFVGIGRGDEAWEGLLVSREAEVTESRGKWAAYWEGEKMRPLCDKRAIVFDNHGATFASASSSLEEEVDFRKSSRFFQEFGGQTPELFRLLSTPPEESFASRWFILSLVEACLARIAVFDERLAAEITRVAESRPAQQSKFQGYLGSHQKAGVYPLFTLAHQQKVGFFNWKHRHALLECTQSEEAELADEGINLMNESEECRASIIAPQSDAKKGYELMPIAGAALNGKCPKDFTMDCSRWDCGPAASCEALSIDMLVIHEGALDLIKRNAHVDWEKELATRLYQISPSVVRTSGRGRRTEHLNEGMPFVEFSEVSGALLTSRNKFSLVRALFGAIGIEMEH